VSDVPGDDNRVITPDRFWGFWKGLLLRPFTWFFRMRVYGSEHVPRSGPAVIACNHIAGIDVVVLGAASPRTLRYMAKAELFTYNRVLTWARSPCVAANPTSRRSGWPAACCAPAIPSGSSARARDSPRRPSGRCSRGRPSSLWPKEHP
jgi:1-acyl-sn-glycerol-3-phosphate acyltransferase